MGKDKTRKKQPARAKRPKKINQVPGALVYVGNKETEITSIEIFNYDHDYADKIASNNVEDAFNFNNQKSVTWINVNGLSNTNEIEKLGKHYNLHPLILEDIVTTDQRPKIDEYEDYLYVVFKMLHYNDEKELVIEHISLVLGVNFVLTFQEADGDVFDPLRDRILTGKGRVRSNEADYLMYAIMDAVIDNYFGIVDTVGDKIEAFEDRLFLNGQKEDLAVDIQELKHEILRIRRAVNPLREVISKIEKVDSKLLQEKTSDYLKDLYDHIIQVNENIEISRDMTWGLMGLYMTTISNKMNEVMKVLTIIATIFIPLTFIAGIYGMNFDNMPELQSKYGYFVVWGVMIGVLVLMIIYFRKKRWI